MQHVSFIRMDEGTAEDYALLNALEDEFVVALPDRLLAALASLEDSLAGYQINRLEHSLQSATRAEADGADIELIVGALIHDLGDDLAPLNHSQLAAAIIRPYVRAEVAWIIEHHGVFQMYYYGDAWALIKTPVIFTATMPGLTAASDFAVIGIRWPLIPIIRQSHWRISNQCFAKSLPARLLIRRLSIRPTSRSPAKAIHLSTIYQKGQNPCQKPC